VSQDTWQATGPLKLYPSEKETLSPSIMASHSKRSFQDVLPPG